MGTACGRNRRIGDPGSALDFKPDTDRRADGSVTPSSASSEVKVGSRDTTRTSRSMFITHANGRLEDYYTVGEKRGEGTHGKVFLATRNSDGAERAVKQVVRGSIKGNDMAALMQEIQIMKSMDHPNIVKLFDTYEDRRYLYLVMEMCSGGELLDKIIAAGRLTEVQSAVVIQQILQAIFYMHGQNIAHRDLKPENFLLGNDGPIDADNLIKLIDFGISCECKQGQVLTELCGTPFYVAPQVVTRRYDKSCDLWSCGVIMYTLLSGNVPFNGDSDKIILDKVRAGIVPYLAKDWDHVSEPAKDLVRRLLTRNPKVRIDASAALHHEWIVNQVPQKEANIPANFVNRLSSFINKSVVRKAALQIVAGDMDDEALKHMRQVFQKFDKDGDGMLTVEEMTQGVLAAGLEVPPNFSQILQSIDADGSGIVDYTEFLAAMLDKRKHLSEDAVRQAFGKFDYRGTGKITSKELTHALAGGARGAHAFAGEVEEVMRKYDTDADGNLEFKEFYAMMRGRSSSSDMRKSWEDLDEIPLETHESEIKICRG